MNHRSKPQTISAHRTQAAPWFWPCFWIILPPAAGLPLSLLALDSQPSLAGCFSIGFGAGLMALWLLALASRGAPSAMGVGTLVILFLMALGDAITSAKVGVDPLELSSLLLGAVLAGTILVGTATGDPLRDPQRESNRLVPNLRGTVILVLAGACLITGIGLLFTH